MIIVFLLVSVLSPTQSECKTVEAYDLSDLVIYDAFNDSYLGILKNDAPDSGNNCNLIVIVFGSPLLKSQLPCCYF